MMIRPGTFVILSALALSQACGCSRVHWRLGPDLPLEEAARANRVVLVYFWQPFNEDCARMDRAVFRSEHVAAQMRDVIPVRLNAALNRRRGEELGLREVPSFVVLGPNGEALRRRTGAMDEDQFIAFLVVAKLSR